MKKVFFLINIIAFFWGNILLAQSDNVHHTNLRQADTRINITLHHNRTIGLGAQFYGVKITNNTNDILRVKLEFYCNMVCGERLSQHIGFGDGLEIKPGETIGGKGFWDTDNTSFDAGNRRSSSCLNGGNKSKKIGENEYTAIQNVGYSLISIENVSEKKRKEEAEVKRKKEEQERLRLEKEALAKQKKEQEEKERLEREALAKQKREQEEKARLEREAKEKQERATAQNKPQGNTAVTGSSSSYGASSGTTTVNTPAQNRQAELERQRQLQIQKNEEIKRQQKLAQEEAERKRQQQIQEMQARIEENKRKTEALNAATDQTMAQWAQGNYIEGSAALVNEFAQQGNSDAAFTTLAVGTGLQIASWISENKREKEEAEARRAEQARREEEERRRLAEIEEEKRRILEEQKREFNLLVQESRNLKVEVINKRKRFLNEDVNHTPTYDVFAEDKSPIYIFYVQTNKDYDYYRENITFPDVIQVHITENATLHFSPILAVYPNSSGEYPFIKEMHAEVKNQHIDSEKGKYKIYNWSKNLEDIQLVYNEEANSARAAHFNVAFPEEMIMDLIEAKEEAEINYWEEQAASETDSPKNIQQEPQTIKEPQEIDYWSTPSEVKK